MTTQDNKRIFLLRLARVSLISAIVYLVTALILDSDTSISVHNVLPGSGGIVGPVTVERQNTVMEVDIQQYLDNRNAWSFITAELLDAEQQYLTGFGDELYYETGYDEDGNWSERESDYDNKVTIPIPGDYYFSFNVESNSPVEDLPAISVTIDSKVGSSVPHFAGGMLLLVLATLLNFFGGGILRSFF